MSGRSKARLARIATASIVALPAIARAEPPRVSLRWTAPEGCPPGARVIAEVDRLLGDGGARPKAPLEVRAVVTAAPSGMRVRLETGADGARVRELSGSTCEALADATAVILALMIDPTAVVTPPPPAPPIPAPPKPVSALPPPVIVPAPLPAALPAEPAPRPPLRVRFALAAWARGDVGSLPGASLAAGGRAAIDLGALRVEAGAGAAPARSAFSSAKQGAGGDIGLVAGELGVCYRLMTSAAIELSPCLAVELGRLHATGFGVTAPGAGSALWSAGRAGGLVAWAPLARLALGLRVEAVVPFARPLFELTNVGDVHRSGPVAGRTGAEVELRF